MPLSRTDVLGLVQDQLWPALQQERQRLDQIDLWYRWQHEDVVIPRRATAELQSLLQLAKTPWLGLVVTNVAQAMYVDGYRSPDSADNAEGPWRLWQANDLDGRQIAVHRAMLAYGQAYGTGLPGTDDFGRPTAVLRGVSPRKMLAFYADPAEDDWPMYALRAEPTVGQPQTFRLYDEEAVYYLGWESTASGSKLVYLEDRIHDVGVCPVVRFANQLDLDGRTPGEVEPFIPLAKRIDKTVYDRLLTQHFSSWKVRTVAGMAAPDPEEVENVDAWQQQKKTQLRQDDILVAEDPDTKFGTLPETPLDGFIRAAEADVKSLAAASQTPTHALTGDLINIGPEALAAARAELEAKTLERKKSAGKSHDQWLRLGALIDGDLDAAQDVMAHVTWADTSVRSMASAADALGKMAQMLGVPPKALWRMIPGVSKLDVDEWEKMAQESDSLGALTALLDRQATPPVPPAA